MKRAWLWLSLVLGLASFGCDDIWRHYTGGVSGESFEVEGQRAILNNGYRQGQVTWVVVVNWPEGSTSEARLADPRFRLDGSNQHVVRAPDGSLAPPREGWAYVFDGDNLVTFPIQMTEDDFMSFRPAMMTRYSEVEAFLRGFELTNEGTGRP